MIKLKKRDAGKPPEIMISPMIDMMFLLLVFFIFGTMYMTESKILDMRLPTAENALAEMRGRFTVVVREDGSLLLDGQPATLDALVALAAAESKKDGKFSVIIRADRETGYRHVVKLLDRLKGGGVTRIALATETGGES
jgi:biopolymer transport protein ExbD